MAVALCVLHNAEKLDAMFFMKPCTVYLIKDCHYCKLNVRNFSFLSISIESLSKKKISLPNGMILKSMQKGRLTSKTQNPKFYKIGTH